MNWNKINNLKLRKREWVRERLLFFKAPIYSATKLLYDKLYVFIKLSFVLYLLFGTIPTSSFNWNLLFSFKQFFTVNIVYKSGVDSPKNQINNQNVNKNEKVHKKCLLPFIWFCFPTFFLFRFGSKYIVCSLRLSKRIMFIVLMKSK